MSNSFVRAPIFCTLVGLGLLSACASGPELADPAALPASFAPAALSPALAKQLPAGAPGSRFGQLVLSTQSNSELTDGRKESWTAVMTLVDGGHGLIQTMTELSSNQVPYGRIHSLSYRGLIDLRWQNVQLSGNGGGPLYEVKAVSRFDALPAGPGQEFAYEFQSGAEAQTANFQTSQRSCKSVRTLPANELHAKLPGQATELACSQKNNNGAPNTSRWMLLEHYGVAVLVESRSGARKIDVRLLDVKS